MMNLFLLQLGRQTPSWVLAHGAVARAGTHGWVELCMGPLGPAPNFLPAPPHSSITSSQQPSLDASTGSGRWVATNGPNSSPFSVPTYSFVM